MLITATLPAALGVTLVSISGRAEGALTVSLVSERASVVCPRCGTVAAHVHSRYYRTVADLPWQGLAVQLRLEVRRFFCEAATCPRQIFAEQFPGLVAGRGRRTERLRVLYSAVGLALGGEPGARLVAELGLTISADTLLRLVC